MATLKQFTIYLAISIVALMIVLTGIPHAVATDTKVKITFSATGYSSYNGVVLTIDGDTYSNTQSFQWTPGSAHTVTAVSSINGWDSNVYSFVSWTNGAGLTTNTGTYTVPIIDTQVTANYVKTTYTARFIASFPSNINGNVLKIDGDSYTVSALSSSSFLWTAGSTHTIQALQPVYSYDTPPIGYNFTSWNNGNGLVSASGTFIMPASDVTVTANYAQSTVQVTFSTSGLSNLNGGQNILTVDGNSYDYWGIQNLKLQWMIGSTNSISAVSSITGWDNAKHDFNTWTNGDGLTTNNGTYTTPTSNVLITANYVTSTTTKYTARFATSGMSNINSNVLQIDGLTYSYSDLPSKTFLWAAGSTHTVVALQPVYSYDTPPKGYNFTGWTNGNGLVAVSDTFTMPESDVTVTANYAQVTVKVVFSTNGLSNLNGGQNILTVDGTSYDYWGIQNLNLQWMKGSIHSISAVGSITGWDNVKHYFRTWTNGNGLTSSSGTFTTPNDDVAVALNYGLTPTIATTVTVECSVTSVTPGSPVTIMGTLTGEGLGVGGKTVSLTYYNGATWVSIGSAATTSSGSYSYGWTISSNIANGEYPLKATFGGDVLYLASSGSTGTPGNGGNVHVLPESGNSIVVLFACFVGAFLFLVLRARKSKQISVKQASSSF